MANNLIKLDTPISIHFFIYLFSVKEFLLAMSQIIIKIDNENVHLSPRTVLPIRGTNFPIAHCQFRSHKEVFWNVVLLEYYPSSKCWNVKVLDYSPSDVSSFKRQKSTKEVNKVVFEKFDWLRLEPLLSSYQRSAMQGMLYNGGPRKFSFEDTALKAHKNVRTESKIVDTNPQQIARAASTDRLPYTKTYSISFSVNFADAQFAQSFVKFSRQVKEVGKLVDFQIANDYLRAEFDNIKSWFSRKFKSKKFEVNATIITIDGKITEVSASSIQISMINPNLIESVIEERTIALTKTAPALEVDRALFTAGEIFSNITMGEIEGNAFGQKENDILNLLLNKTQTRNRKQLEYLSGNRQSELLKLRFTLYPKFGFVFFIEGKLKNHFVWELLNTNATYIWSFDRLNQEIETQYKTVETAINSIRQNGRSAYKRVYKQNKDINNFWFYSIEHNDVSSITEDGFMKWKHKLEEKIS